MTQTVDVLMLVISTVCCHLIRTKMGVEWAIVSLLNINSLDTWLIIYCKWNLQLLTSKKLQD